MIKEVAFHHGAADKLAYAFRLVRKAYRAGVAMVVTADADTLRQFDRYLWVFDAQEFLPHYFATQDKACPNHLLDTPIWLTCQPKQVLGKRQTLINLGIDIPTGFEDYDRLFDIVCNDEHDREAGRLRWQQYKTLGLNIQAHHIQN